MVLERLSYFVDAKHRSWEMGLIGFVYATVGLLLSAWIWEEEASLIMVFLTVMACVPVMYNTLRTQEEKDVEMKNEVKIFKAHTKAVKKLMFLFLGITLAYVFWYVVLPGPVVSNLFETQMDTISRINQRISGQVTNDFSVFNTIFFNNLKVLIFCILFSLLYGAGAIFILTWNASVIGAAIGNFIRIELQEIAISVGFTGVANYFQIFSLGLLRYSLHGIPEIIAYFYGGMAGGIISYAIIKHHYSTRKFSQVIVDASDTLIFSVLLLIVAAVLEVYVTPLLF